MASAILRQGEGASRRSVRPRADVLRGAFSRRMKRSGSIMTEGFPIAKASR